CASGAGPGGAIYVDTTTGNVTIESSTFERSSAVVGAGLYADVDGSLSVSGSAFTDGVASSGPAAIFSAAVGTFTLTNTRFERNEAPSATGGALYHSG